MRHTAPEPAFSRVERHAREMYPDALIRTRSIHGQPGVLALEDNLIRLIRLTDLDAKRR